MPITLVLCRNTPCVFPAVEGMGAPLLGLPSRQESRWWREHGQGCLWEAKFATWTGPHLAVALAFFLPQPCPAGDESPRRPHLLSPEHSVEQTAPLRWLLS